MEPKPVYLHSRHFTAKSAHTECSKQRAMQPTRGFSSGHKYANFHVVKRNWWQHPRYKVMES